MAKFAVSTRSAAFYHLTCVRYDGTLTLVSCGNSRPANSGANRPGSCQGPFALWGGGRRPAWLGTRCRYVRCAVIRCRSGRSLLLSSPGSAQLGCQQGRDRLGISASERGSSNQPTGKPSRSVSRFASASSMRFVPFSRCAMLDPLTPMTTPSLAFDPLRTVST